MKNVHFTSASIGFHNQFESLVLCLNQFWSNCARCRGKDNNTLHVSFVSTDQLKLPSMHIRKPVFRDSDKDFNAYISDLHKGRRMAAPYTLFPVQWWRSCRRRLFVFHLADILSNVAVPEPSTADLGNRRVRRPVVRPWKSHMHVAVAYSSTLIYQNCKIQNVQVISLDVSLEL